MNTKPNQLQMYGCDINEFVEDVMDSITYRVVGANMVVAGLMSDAQEQVAHGDYEGARQTLNRAKHLLNGVMQGALVGNQPQTKGDQA